MEPVWFRVRIDGQWRCIPITRAQAEQAMADYDREYPRNEYCEPPVKKRWLENASYLYAVRHHGRLYPPKHIIARATGIPLQGVKFRGGEGDGDANDTWRKLGFEVIPLSPAERRS